MAEQSGNDVRVDVVTAERVDQGLSLCTSQGIHPALQFMEASGVPRSIALRVLCSPEHFRKRDRRAVPRLKR